MTDQTGEQALEEAWWSVIDELHSIILMSEDVGLRIKAADTLLRYFAALNTGINAPFVPDKRPEEDPSEDDD